MLPFLRDNIRFLTAGALLTLLSGFGQTYFISLFAGDIRRDFGLSHGEWGALYMMGTMASAVVMIWAGVLTDIFRVRVLGPVVLVALALASLSMAWNPAVWALPLIVFALRFLGQGMMTHIAVVAMARWYVATRGRALFVASLGFSAGEAFVPLIVVSLLGLVAWQSIWMAGSVICLLAVPLMLFLLRQERQPRDLAKSNASLGMGGRHWTRRDSLQHPLFWAMIPAILGPAAFNTAFVFHQVHIADVKGISHLAFVAFFPVFTVVSVTMMGVMGWAIDRFGTARLMPFYQLPMVAGFVAFGFADTLWMLGVGFACLGLTSGANATLPNAFWAEFYGTAHIGSIKALAAAVMVLGSALGPGLTGALIDLDIGIETQFFWIAAYFVLATGTMVWGIGRAAHDLPGCS